MMKKRHIMLIFIFLLALSLRLYRYAHLQVLPESDVYYYINIFNNILSGGKLLQGGHPGFNAFMGFLGIVTKIDFFILFVHVGPFIGSTLVFVIYILGKKLYNFKVGLFSALIVAITPLAIIRGGQTIAETLAFPFLVIYIMLLYDTTNKISNKSLFLIPLFISIMIIHNLTGAVTIFISLLGFFFYMLLKKEYKKSTIFAITLVALVSIIYFTPSDKLPAFKESYDLLYRSVKQYLSSFSFGADTKLSWKKFDLLFPSILLTIPGLIISAYNRKREDLFLVVLFFTLVSLTQLFRANFNFLPHRFLIYTIIPISLGAGRFLAYLFEAFNIEKIRYSNYLIVIPLGLIVISSLSFNYDLNFLVAEEDFESLTWARENLDGNIATYSKINNKSQNKYTAISNNNIKFNNSFFNTGAVDYAILEIVSGSFEIPLGESPSEGDTVYYTSLANEYKGFIRLNKSDRCMTSLNIINTFWGSPEIVGICDGIDYEKGVSIAKEFNLPLILYSNERYEEVIDNLENWNCEVVLIDDIEVLRTAFDYKRIPYSNEINELQEHEKMENTYIYYDNYDSSLLEIMVNEYMYLSKEAQTDFPNLESHCDETTLIKLYDTRDTGYYYKIKD